MKRTAIAVLLAFAVVPALAQEPTETPAEPLLQRSPHYPEACLIAIPDEAGPQRVAVTYDVTKDGLPENVRVRESSHPCFDDSAVAAVRSWKFEPRRVNGRKSLQTDVETVFVFKIETETKTDTFDARPKKRIPPRFPDHCQSRASSEEIVVVVFDVTVNGETDNIRVADTTNSCFNRAATRSVEKWLYIPRIEDGKPVRRENVLTQIKFQLGGGASPSREMRRRLVNRLNKAGRLIKSDPERALEMLETIEAEYGDTFTASESAAFHQIRGFARIGVNDAYGALDDLRIARLRASSPDEREAIETAIGQLEKFIAQSNASVESQPAEDEDAPQPEEPTAE